MTLFLQIFLEHDSRTILLLVGKLVLLQSDGLRLRRIMPSNFYDKKQLSTLQRGDSLKKYLNLKGDGENRDYEAT